MRFLITALLALALVTRAHAQCPTNAAGGPTLVTLNTPATNDVTDFDIGTSARAHGIPLPGLALAVCLDECDASTDPACTITSIRPDASSPGLAPPLPVVVSNVPLCIALRFPTPAPAASGSANVQTGALSLSTTLQMQLFSGSMNAICPSCVTGTCSGGANHGSPCTINRVATVSTTTYNLSSACQPAPLDLFDTVSVPVTLTTGTASQATCPSQPAGDACSIAPAAGTCNDTACAQGVDGIVQDCCSNDDARSCFPAAGVTRQGQPNAPAPAWPSTTYPKQAQELIVSASCVAGAGVQTNVVIGLPGPAALTLGVTSNWANVDTGTTTTTLGGGGTTTTTLPGNCDPACGDDDTCTTDTCTGTTCSYPLASPGIAGARCVAKRMQSRPLCGTDTVDAKLSKTIGRALPKIDSFLAKADTATGKKRTKALKKARAQLVTIDKKTTKTAGKGKIEDACKTTILNETSRIRAALADVS